jgi:rubrerythrin
MLMHKPTDTGTNRTGIATSPFDSPELIQGAQAAATGAGDGAVLRSERVSFARIAEPVGTVPPPASIKGMAKTLLEKVQGHKPTVFIDKLGQRLAYERTGVRLYDALLVKYDAATVHEGGPTRAQLESIRADEHRHLLMVRDAIAYLGADPTAMTPCADVTGVASLGWIQVLSDPRTTLTQCLDLMLAVEVADVEGWTLLTELATSLGFDDLAERFRAANLQEAEHATRMRGWAALAVLGQAGTGATSVAKPKGMH